MSQTNPAVPSVSWRRRALRRSAMTVGTAVVIAGIVPAAANAAGAHVANPVAFALRASGHTFASAFGLDETNTCSTDTTVETPAPSVEPSESVAASVEPSVAPSEGPSESVAPSESDAPVESATPAADESTAPSESVAPPSATCSEPSESESPEAPESPEASEASDHGAIVSTVAHCAPRGKDPLLAVDGAPQHHGGYVSAAAHGDTLTTPWGTFDLSTQAGADALCAALDTARAALPTPSPAVHGKHGTHGHAKPAKGEHGHGHAKDGGTSDGSGDADDATEGTSSTD